MSEKVKASQQAQQQDADWPIWTKERLAEFRKKFTKLNKCGEWFFSDKAEEEEPLGTIVDYKAVFNS